MVYFDDEMTHAAESRYGEPATHRMSYPASPREVEIIRRSQVDGRKHDVTIAIFGEPGVIVIAKPWYTHRLFRLPSGGLKPGETLEEGAAREAYEETGVEMELVRYHVRIDVDFVGEEVTIPWTSHVFSARYLAGEVKPVDTDEIREARWCPMSDLLVHRALMMKSTVSGLNYRAALQDAYLDHLESLDWLRRDEREIELLSSPLTAGEA